MHNFRPRTMQRAVTTSWRAILEEFNEDISPSMVSSIAIPAGMLKKAGFVAI